MHGIVFQDYCIYPLSSILMLLLHIFLLLQNCLLENGNLQNLEVNICSYSYIWDQNQIFPYRFFEVPLNEMQLLKHNSHQNTYQSAVQENLHNLEYFCIFLALLIMISHQSRILFYNLSSLLHIVTLNSH